MDGNDITLLPSFKRVSLGLAYLIQGGRIFPDLTVEENFQIAGIHLPIKEKKENIAFIFRLFYNLKEMAKKRAGLLSGGERQAVALGMILMKKPKVLLLDEPSAGLSPKLVKEMIGKIKDINDRMGTTILLIEQNIGEALKISKRAIALANGEIVLERDKPSMLLSGKELEGIFLGRESVI